LTSRYLDQGGRASDPSLPKRTEHPAPAGDPKGGGAIRRPEAFSHPHRRQTLRRGGTSAPSHRFAARARSGSCPRTGASSLATARGRSTQDTPGRCDPRLQEVTLGPALPPRGEDSGEVGTELVNAPTDQDSRSIRPRRPPNMTDDGTGPALFHSPGGRTMAVQARISTMQGEADSPLRSEVADVMRGKIVGVESCELVAQSW
jgi:hypothetical protein